jgi:pimeloyl-ACP methyl ester carboxylesterase
MRRYGMRRRRRLPLAGLLLALLVQAVQAQPMPAPEFACQRGAWRLDDGAVFSLNPSGDGLRYRFVDGRIGRFAGTTDDELAALEGWRSTGEAIAQLRPGDCGADRLAFRFAGGDWNDAHRIALVQREIRFDSGGIELQGRLVQPAAAAPGRPLAILVHGSENTSALVFDPLQYLLPAQGVAVFVYDKRGTGRSRGRYSQDFDLLASDAIAALNAARSLAPGAFARAGFVGGSQGGWVAPLAASRTEVDFAVALFGMAESPLAEDREQAMNDLRAAGYGDEVLARAREVTDATGVLMASRLSRGMDTLQQVRRKYAHEPWFAALRGEFSGPMLELLDGSPQARERVLARFEDVGTSWDYEPMPVLRALAVPQLWVIASDDLDAPNVETLRRLRRLQREGRPIDLAVFPRTMHGMFEYTVEAGYVPLLAQWLRNAQLGTSHPGAELEPRQAAASALAAAERP